MKATEQELTTADLRYFHEMDEAEKSDLWENAQSFLVNEAANLETGTTIYPHLEAVNTGLMYGGLVSVDPNNDLFGIVSPIRQRHRLPRSEIEGSLPILHSHTSEVLASLASDIKQTGSDDAQMFEVFDRNGISDFRISVTSLLRTTLYQKKIASDGRFAVGYDGSSPQHSAHERAVAIDIDHGGMYVTFKKGLVEVPLNRESPNELFNIFAQVLPVYRRVLRKVINAYMEESVVMALEEVPNGWGCWHVSTPLNSIL